MSEAFDVIVPVDK